MHDDFINSLKWQYSSYSTPELLSIWRERDDTESNYIEETFEAVRQILSEREALPSDSRADGGKPEGPTPSEDARKGSFSFSCVFCSRKLRIHFPVNLGSYACPSCKARYEPVHVHDDPPVILLVPRPQGDARKEPEFAKDEVTLPPDIKTALGVLGLTEFASFEDAKQAYRNTVRQYHPDRVTHLGPELQTLAESKTKELIAAYEKIRRFFGGLKD